VLVELSRPEIPCVIPAAEVQDDSFDEELLTWLHTLDGGVADDVADALLTGSYGMVEGLDDDHVVFYRRLVDLWREADEEEVDVLDERRGRIIYELLPDELRDALRALDAHDRGFQ
jgi:hypothetical protein